MIVGRLLVLRGFDYPAELTHERKTILSSGNPFGIGNLLTIALPTAISPAALSDVASSGFGPDA